MKKLKKLNLLYIEDDIKTRDSYINTFNLIFNRVFAADSYDEAISIYDKELIDFILVDIELNSKKNGFDISKTIREINIDVPIVFLTGHDKKEFILKAINSNMNGYIVKPLSIDKFLEITNSLCSKINFKQNIEFNEFTYDFDTLELFSKNGSLISLGKKENTLLQIFLKNRDKLLNREFLEYEIWNESLPSDSTLKNLIASLRKKIGKESITNISKLGWIVKIA